MRRWCLDQKGGVTVLIVGKTINSQASFQAKGICERVKANFYNAGGTAKGYSNTPTNFMLQSPG